MVSVRELLSSLQRDIWRKENPFSQDIQLANDVILDPFATDYEKAQALSYWVQGKGNQPCLFGRIAAWGRMHFCILSDADLLSSDKSIRQKIQRERLIWKQGCLWNEHPEHGFMVLAASKRLVLAAPDENLYRLVCRLRELLGCKIRKDRYGNDITWETLFLQNPQTKKYVKFTFTVDYFGAQGDKRWWHDHRVPAGVAFTSNSVGHMVQTREWYDGHRHQNEWALEVAMRTVEEAAQTSWGKAIWLRELRDGKPLMGGDCPFRDPSSLKSSLRGKDWSCYAGYLSTDHSVRREIFRLAPERPAELKRKWAQDLTYIYDPAEKDHKKFMEGEPVTAKEVFAEIGQPARWRVLYVSPIEDIRRSKQRKDRIAHRLNRMRRKWAVKKAPF